MLVMISGCVGISSIRYSQATPESGAAVTLVQEKYVGEMYVVNDLAYHVYPVNSVRKDLMLFPFPFPTSSPTKGSSPFVVGIALKADSIGYSFEPARVEYLNANAQRIQPVRIQGPFPCNSQKAPPAWRPANEVVEQLPKACVYMWLEFETTPPDPATPFFVRVAGVHSAVGDVMLPALHFEEGTRNETFSVP